MNCRKSGIQPFGSAIAPCLHCDFELAGHTVAIINAAAPPTAALKITAHPRHTGSTAFFRIIRYPDFGRRCPTITGITTSIKAELLKLHFPSSLNWFQIPVDKITNSKKRPLCGNAPLAGPATAGETRGQVESKNRGTMERGKYLARKHGGTNRTPGNDLTQRRKDAE